MTTVRSPVMLVDPTVATVGASAQMARRPLNLEGLTVGLLHNGKHNADRILDGAYRMLGERYQLTGAVHHRKEMPSKRFAPDVLDDVATRCQIAITAVGD